ncbi:replicative helicase [Caudoviricetes sp.]|nr:replicative helicase [Caudoviricetes sp.]
MRWFGAEELLAASRAHPLGRGDAPEIVEASRATLLFLDDAGWDRDPSVVSSLLNERYERQTPTVITTGKTAEELTAHYGAAVVRRMVETGGRAAALVNCFPKVAQ